MRETAEAFEASFLSQMLKPMFEGLKTDGMFGGGQQSAQAASPQVLGDILGQERQVQQQQGGLGGVLLGAVLDQDGDGQLGLGDLLKMGGSILGGQR